MSSRHLPLGGTPEDVLAGQVGRLRRDLDMLRSTVLARLAAPQWLAYSPVWTASGTNPNLGDGTLAGAFVKHGRTVHFRLELQAGSTTTFGSGAWIFTLPTDAGYAPGQPLGLVNMRDQSAGTLHTGFAYRNAVGDFAVVPTTGTSLVQGTVPFTWAATDYLRLSGTYQAA